MAILSDLSIGVIVGGIFVCSAIIIGFIIWKVLDVQRRNKQSSCGGPDSPVGTENAASYSDNQSHARDRMHSSSVYSEVFYDSERQSVALENNTYVGRAVRINNQSYSGSDSQSDNAKSEQYSRLHEVQRQVENMYNDVPDPVLHPGTASAYSHKTDQQNYNPSEATLKSTNMQNQDYLEATPTSNTFTIMQNQDYSEDTPKRTGPASDDVDCYTLPIPHVQVIELLSSLPKQDSAQQNHESEAIDNSADEADEEDVKDDPCSD